MSHPRENQVIGICGGSGSGKTTLAEALVNLLGIHRCLILSQDCYYKDQSHRFTGDGSVNFDHPDAIDFALKAHHIAALKRGETVDVPVYDFATHRRLDETATYEPREFILVDGTLILSQEQILMHLHQCVFLDICEEVRFQRRLRRDTQERGRTVEGVTTQFYQQVKPMHDQFIAAHVSRADVVLQTDDEIQAFLDGFGKRTR